MIWSIAIGGGKFAAAMQRAIIRPAAGGRRS
jgi:hypothetical protein